MSNAIVVHEHGGPDVMRFEPVAPVHPKAGEVLVRHTAIGINFLDIYFRTGLYKPPSLPFTPGNEAAGVVEQIGEGVGGLQPGDRVAYVGPLGAYAQERVIAADRLVKIPDPVSDEQAAAMMLKGMTAHYLLHRTYAVKPGDTILCHAAAGGVGQLVGQWAKHLGARTIGTAGSEEKVALALAHGYDHVIDYRREDFVARVLDITGGKRCDVVYDSVGKDTFFGSLDCLRPLGMLVTFGQSSGSVGPVDLAVLSQKGSLFVTRPTLFTYIAARSDLEASAAALFDAVAGGVLSVDIGRRYALDQAPAAHEDLQARRTSGSSVLVP